MDNSPSTIATVKAFMDDAKASFFTKLVTKYNLELYPDPVGPLFAYRHIKDVFFGSKTVHTNREGWFENPNWYETAYTQYTDDGYGVMVYESSERKRLYLLSHKKDMITLMWNELVTFELILPRTSRKPVESPKPSIIL